ncbi:MAG: D-2-hydroxyacid dehydrogenase [Tepidisphaeraceae bacterium]
MSTSSKPLTIWCSRLFVQPLLDRFEDAVKPHRVLYSADAAETNLLPCVRDPALFDDVQIAFGQPPIDDIFASKSLRWIQLTSAGYTRYDRDDLRQSLKARGIALCNASGVYDEPCAQHVVAMMLALARQLPAAYASQLGDHGWPYLPLRARSRILANKELVLLVGYGAIAKRIAEILKGFDLEVVAFRRTVRGDEVVPTHSIDKLDGFLPRAQHVVNILPASPSTRHLFDPARIARIKPGSFFYNIGRGDTVDQDALVDSLRAGHFAHAYLDVTTPEPLPKEHPLWSLPNCYITPHTAGGTVDESMRQIEHFARNLRRFDAGEPLADRIV